MVQSNLILLKVKTTAEVYRESTILFYTLKCDKTTTEVVYTSVEVNTNKLESEVCLEGHMLLASPVL